MNLKKAIEILRVESKTAQHQVEPDFYDALELGIEALEEKLQPDHRDQEEHDFLNKILHMPFFEFCLLVKERKQALEKGGAK